ncbi:MAG: hypothetical protein NTX27_04595 [Verrucomicrobia bacterium]|nr:hypothetical protein [Verrucomicrobiota bacterium]
MTQRHVKSLILATGWLITTLTTGHAADWLLDGSTFKAEIHPGQTNREITLENGLIRRVFRLEPNAATVSFENLMSGESIIRAVRPEARLVLDGVPCDVGGLGTQPVQNFLKPGWINALEANPDAFQFTGFKTGRTTARFPWKKRTEWMPADAPWPPPGVSLTLEFQSPDGFGGVDQPREAMVSDDFTELSKEWKLFLSKKDARTSFQNEGKPGEIMARENTHAFAERSWPQEATTVECQVDPGTDKSASWGPGIALVFGEKVVRFYLRPGHGCFGLLGGDGEKELGKMEGGKPYTLRMTLRSGKILCDASLNGRKWVRIGDTPAPGNPTAVRIGKLSRDGRADDFSPDGDLERCFVRAFRIYGPGQSEKPLVKSAPSGQGKVTVEVHYELFDGLPLISKWIVVRNGTTRPVRLNSFISEVLATVEYESYVDDNPRWELPNLYVETDYAFGGMGSKGGNRGVRWGSDPEYLSQVNYNRNTPCLLECKPPQGPDQEIAPGGSFESFRAFELAQDSTDRERKGLAQRRMYRAIAPWATENPILMHVRSARPEAVKLAIDQCAAVGFEMVILTFGSGFNFESRDKDYQAGLKTLADYAKSKGIVLGGYSLCASRGAATPADNTVGPTAFGVAPCLGATWGQDYLQHLKTFMDNTGLAVLEHDGSYPGDTCASTNHPFHKGFEDSQWVQWKAITDLYKWCRANGVYLNIPDWYFLSGSTKTGMGYREVNWSLPREFQEIIERQNIFDGTWEKAPSMGWMFVPLTEYQGGGAAATIEPLSEHLDHYGQRLANLFGAGVMACYRGPRLYDTDSTMAVVKHWVDFYKKHREVLNSDILHLRRADGRDLDYILHVNPCGKEKGLLMVYNPLENKVRKTLQIPLYHTGKTTTATLREQDGKSQKLKLDRDYRIQLPVEVPARGVTWFVIE